VKPSRYPIRAVSKLTGIPVDTLRAWERRYRVVEPARDERGRLYSAGDVERLRLLRRAVDGGHAIGRVAPLSTAELEALLAQPTRAPATPVEPDLSALQDAVDRLDAAAFRRELSRLAAILSLRALCRDVALPFLHLVGEAWHEGKLGVAQEHMASAEIRGLLGGLARLHEARDGSPALVLATPAGELHEIATLAATVVASDAGLGAIYLGPDVPSGEIVAAASRLSAKAVVLGWTGRRGEHGKDPRAAIAAVARDLPRAIELWVGGEGAGEAARSTGGRAVALESFGAYEHALSRIHVR
jgi:DNA-binding transcriptional MerR regulator/methylmalonyl-CoA mutase cobalamin-binding subunit